MKLLFAEAAWENYQRWLATYRCMQARVNKFIREVQRDP